MKKKISFKYTDLDAEDRKKIDNEVDHILNCKDPRSAVRRLLMYHIQYIDTLYSAYEAIGGAKAQIAQARQVLKSMRNVDIDERGEEAE